MVLYRWTDVNARFNQRHRINGCTSNLSLSSPKTRMRIFWGGRRITCLQECQNEHHTGGMFLHWCWEALGLLSVPQLFILKACFFTQSYDDNEWTPFSPDPYANVITTSFICAPVFRESLFILSLSLSLSRSNFFSKRKSSTFFFFWHFLSAVSLCILTHPQLISVTDTGAVSLP